MVPNVRLGLMSNELRPEMVTHVAIKWRAWNFHRNPLMTDLCKHVKDYTKSVRFKTDSENLKTAPNAKGREMMVGVRARGGAEVCG